MGKGRKRAFDIIPVLEEVDRLLKGHDMMIDVSHGLVMENDQHGNAMVRLAITQAKAMELPPPIDGARLAKEVGLHDGERAPTGTPWKTANIHLSR